MITSSPERFESHRRDGTWPGLTLHSQLALHARQRPDVVAVKDQPDREALTGTAPLALSWAQLDNASANLAARLLALGVGEDDRVLVQLPNVVELVVAYYALSRIGAVVSPAPVQYGAHELQMIAHALHPALVLTAPRLREAALADLARAALPDVPLAVFGEDLHLDLAPGAETAGPDDPDRVVSICWTSGTTGTPKGVPRSHNMWFATGSCSAAAGGYVADDVLLNPFPLVNMAALGGFLFPAAMLGCTLVLHHPLDPPLFLAQLQDERVTFTIAPPPLLNQLAKAPQLWRQFDFSALRRVGSGSAPLAPWMVETFSADYGIEVVNFYGSNEGIALFATPETAPEPQMRAGLFPRPEPGSAIATRVADPATGEEVTATGERGELLISGPTVFDGYYQHDNRDVFTDDGYFRTGDLVEISGEQGGFYRIVGRCKDIINRGGMKISPCLLYTSPSPRDS